MLNQYISDVVGETYKNWTGSKDVLINAPMGTGKTFFIMNILLPYVYTQNKTILYLANRRALEQQVNESIPEEYSQNILAYSYQKIARLNKNSEPYSFIEDVDYCILDEAHYFLADSSFNMSIKNAKNQIGFLKHENPHMILVYMTATLPYLLLYLEDNNITIPCLSEYKYNDYNINNFSSVKNLLKYKEQNKTIIQNNSYNEYYYENYHDYDYDNYDDEDFDKDEDENYDNDNDYYDNNYYDYYISSTQNRNYFAEISKQCDLMIQNKQDIQQKYNYYHIEQDFSYIDPIFFNKWDEIISAILLSPENEKWMIFVANKKNGELLKQSLQEHNIYNIAFINAENKTAKGLREQEAFQYIVENEMFEQRVLIATKVLDNGINIHDSSLRHMVIETFEETTFLQMLGRKRRQNNNERLNLYLRNISEGDIRKRFKQHILNIVIFLNRLIKIQNIKNRSGYSIKTELKFTTKYIDNGHYKKPYVPFLEERDMSFSPIGNKPIKSIDEPVIQIYKPAKFAVKKLAYDYYKTMAMFEKAQNERFLYIEEMNIEDWSLEKKLRIWNEKLEKQIQKIQFMWLHQQLAWIGMDDSEHSPQKNKNWLSVHSGLFDRAIQEMLTFLDKHSDNEALTPEKEKILKELFCNWIKNIRPVHKDANSKGSISVINRCLKEYGIKYEITSKKKTINKKQRNWWYINKV